jgi:hypothetical protein
VDVRGSRVKGQLGLHRATLSQKKKSLALVAHTCNPSYSGSRDQEDRSLKPAQANSVQDPIAKKLITKKGLVAWPWVQTPLLEKKNSQAQWLMALILSTQEAEIRRIKAGSQPRQMIQTTLTQKYPTQTKDWWNGSSGRAPDEQVRDPSSNPSTTNK